MTSRHISERILRLVRDEIDRSGSVGTNVSRIAAALRQQGVDPITARDACQQLIAQGEAEYSPYGGGVIHVRIPERKCV